MMKIINKKQKIWFAWYLSWLILSSSSFFSFSKVHFVLSNASLSIIMGTYSFFFLDFSSSEHFWLNIFWFNLFICSCGVFIEDVVEGPNSLSFSNWLLMLSIFTVSFFVGSILPFFFEQGFSHLGENLDNFLSFDDKAKKAKNYDFFILEFHDFLQSIFQLILIIFF